MGEEMIPFRSFLFSPAIRPEMMEKAPRSGADSLIFDLEDSVPAQLKDEARGYAAEALQREGTPPVFIRVNHPATGEMEADLQATVSEGLFGVILPKVETPGEMVRLDAVLSQVEAAVGVSPGRIAVLPLLESCRGLHFTYEIATASPRVQGMVFSSGEEGDFMVDIGGNWTPEGEAFLYPRSKLVCETRAAGLDAPIDGVFMNLSDEPALRRECRLARNMGFTGKMAIHPKQISVIHDVFTPSDEEVAYSRGLIEAFRAAEASGNAAITYQGMMVDYANLKRAERILALADNFQAQ
jgi:citrate lyase subunit beta/citryl-CoA lyase